MKASIIVSNLEPQGVLLPCISVLCNQGFAGKYEVIFPYKGNVSREEQTILRHYEKQYPHFRVVDVPGNRSISLNNAVRQSEGDLLLFMESHCVTGRDWLSRYFGLFKEKKFQAAFMDIRCVPSDCWVSNAVINQRSSVINKLLKSGRYDAYFDLHSSAVTRDCFEEFGGFREELPSLAEFEFGARLHHKGIKIFKVQDYSIWHFNNRTMASYEKIIKGQGRDRTRILFKNGEEFFKSYFSNELFIRLLPLFRTFRLPLVALMQSLIYGNAAGFKLCEMLNLNEASGYFFKKFAVNCHRYGMLRELK